MRSARIGHVIRAVAAGAILAAVLAGCVSVPTTGAVQQGGTIRQDTDAGVSLTANAPTPGADPTDIVNGFLEAQAVADEKFAVAREYLASSVAKKWNPLKAVSISAAAPRVLDADPSTPTTRTVSFTESAHVDAGGSYTQDTSGATSTRDFDLVQEHGEWRIAGPAADLDGIVLSAAVFTSVFNSYALYFYDPSYHYLVPDVRWYPNTSVTSTNIVEGMLAGPTTALAQSVTSAFPVGTKLTSLVSLAAGAAVVDFDDSASAGGQSIDDASLETRLLMRAQLLASLSSYTSVLSLDMTVGGVELATPTSAAKAVVNPSVGAQPIVLSGDSIVSAGTGKGTPLGAVTDAARALAGIEGGSYRVGAQTLAVLAADGVFRVDGTGVDPVDPRADLIAPSVDPYGIIWSATSAGAIEAIDADDTSREVTQSFVPAGGRLVSLDVSRDGTRLLLYIAGPDGANSLVVVGIVRVSGRVPTLASTGIQLPVATGLPVDAAWVDDQTVATISGGGAGTVATAYLVGGPAQRLGSVPNAVAITGGNGGVTGLRILTSDGTLLAERSVTFQDTGVSATALFTQQPD
ncbi:GerMN domain-containing protein [Galbitalea sp. SE-J8]|uniref:LpqB family beta-propeller domain-containing protein n=1 Tax=Galbitalea sp. SE-J8 TaxID=3054952 RepID=UPI00259CA857|nr:LpqB family beta-propeller domain-containing protein [Galbitalea sp. SE-J8]MDM4762703.1 GerMN domain-containing protein [Galbitalea sp. SE-J8]